MGIPDINIIDGKDIFYFDNQENLSFDYGGMNIGELIST